MSSDQYLAATFDAAIPGSFRVPVLTRPGDKAHPFVVRTQLPLMPAAAITVHKSQGMSLAFFQALFGDSELALGCTYVQLSRAVALSGIVLKDTMTLKRLIGLSQSERADQRCAFDIKCEEGAIKTLRIAREACTAASEAPLAAELDAAIAEAETELVAAKAALKRRIDAKAAQKAAAIAARRK